MLQGALDMATKTAEAAMTPLEKVGGAGRAGGCNRRCVCVRGGNADNGTAGSFCPALNTYVHNFHDPHWQTHLLALPAALLPCSCYPTLLSQAVFTVSSDADHVLNSAGLPASSDIGLHGELRCGD